MLIGSTAVSRFSLFPDQRQPFLAQAEQAIAAAMGRQIKVLTPLIEFGKADVRVPNPLPVLHGAR